MQTNRNIKTRPGAKSKLKQSIHGLYAIADTGILSSANLISAVGQAIQGGVSLVQLRHKSTNESINSSLSPILLRSIALSLQKLCTENDVIFIINDDVQLAAAIKADGVHLGQEDLPITEARKILGAQAIIGISCYNQLSLAQTAQTQGADYVAFGSFFSSATKPDAVSASLALAQEACSLLELPIVAIGGITPDNAGPLISAGVSSIAAASGIFGQSDIKAAAQAYCKLFYTPLGIKPA